MAKTLLIAAAAAALLAAGGARADTVNWGQLGVPSTPVSDPVTVTSVLGVIATASDDGTGLYAEQQGVTWGGDFDPGESLLYTAGSAPITVSFDHFVNNLNFSVQPDINGTFTAMISYYDMGALVFSQSVTGVSSSTPGAALALSYSGEVTGFSVSTDQSQDGMAIGELRFNDGALIPAAPEPATWALMFAGVGLIGGVMRARSRAERRHAELLASEA